MRKRHTHTPKATVRSESVHPIFPESSCWSRPGQRAVFAVADVVWGSLSLLLRVLGFRAWVERSSLWKRNCAACGKNLACDLASLGSGSACCVERCEWEVSQSVASSSKGVIGKACVRAGGLRRGEKTRRGWQATTGHRDRRLLWL